MGVGDGAAVGKSFFCCAILKGDVEAEATASNSTFSSVPQDPKMEANASAAPITKLQRWILLKVVGRGGTPLHVNGEGEPLVTLQPHWAKNAT